MMNNNNNSTEETLGFNFRSYAKGLIWAGVVGMILSALVSVFLIGNHSWDEFIIVNSQKQTNFILAYYWINTILVLISGFLLFSRKKIGIFILLIVFISIISSLFIPFNEFSSLFVFTVSSSLFFLVVGAPLGVIFFLGAVMVNVFRIRKWDQIT